MWSGCCRGQQIPGSGNKARQHSVHRNFADSCRHCREGPRHDFPGILNWLWEKDEALLSEAPLLSQQALIRFSTKITDDRQKQALLMQCLKNDGGSHKFIRQVLMTFGHQDYAAFLTERNYRSIPRSDAMWQLAVQLGNSGFIRPPKLTHADTRIRIEPFFNAENEYD